MSCNFLQTSQNLARFTVVACCLAGRRRHVAPRPHPKQLQLQVLQYRNNKRKLTQPFILITQIPHISKFRNISLKLISKHLALSTCLISAIFGIMEDTSKIRQRNVPKIQVTRSISDPDEKKNSDNESIDDKALTPKEYRVESEVKTRRIFETNKSF